MDPLVVSLFQVLFMLLIGHALCDFPLQGDFLSNLKNPEKFPDNHMWIWGLVWHGFIHAGAVLLITGSYALAVAECVVHATIDYLKCKRAISFNMDQFLHVAYKVVWAYLVIYYGSYLP